MPSRRTKENSLSALLHEWLPERFCISHISEDLGNQSKARRKTKTSIIFYAYVPSFLFIDQFIDQVIFFILRDPYVSIIISFNGLIISLDIISTFTAKAQRQPIFVSLVLKHITFVQRGRILGQFW